jgi:ABC-type multidrug transport system fused ATPase/permease subunit
MIFKEGLFNFFERLIPPFEDKCEGVPPKGIIKFVLFFSRGLGKFLAAVAVLNSFIAVGEALFFACLGYIVDWTASSSPQNFISEHGGSLLIMLLGAGVFLPVASFLHSLLIHQTLSSNYSMQVRWQLHNFLLGQSLSFFNEEFAGALANKVMQTSMAVRTAVMKLIDVFVHMVVYISTMLIMLMNADFYLCLPLIIWLCFYTCSLFVFIPYLRRTSKELSVERSTMVGRIVDSYTNISTVKLFGGAGKEKSYAKEAMTAFRNSEYKIFRILTSFDISVQFLNCTLLVSLIILSLWLWSNYLVTTGAIAISIAIAIRMINMSRWIMWEAGAIFENIGMIYDCMSTMSKPVAVTDPDNPKTIDSFNESIEFKNVSFGYDGKKEVLSDFNLSIKKGLKIGIVGPSGVGKSTIINLILRFYDVTKGSVTIDGVDVRDLRQDNLRDLFAMVSQEPSLMHRTIGENIEYGSKNELDDEDLQKAARASDSLNFIEEMSDYRGGIGFDSMVGDRGVKLSGGQKQRIAIARVIVKNAPILILDEATSALDSETEEIVQRNLLNIMHGRTVIAIAHRLSTLKSMDRIIVINEGRIVESGSHEELLSLGGLYNKMWSLQSNGFVK